MPPGADPVIRITYKGLFLGLVVLGGLVGATVVTLVIGKPTPLPSIALESTFVLHAERAAVIFTAYLLALMVLVNAFRGELPIELRGVKYSDTATVAASSQDAIGKLEGTTSDHAQRLASIGDKLGELGDNLNQQTQRADTLTEGIRAEEQRGALVGQAALFSHSRLDALDRAVASLEERLPPSGGASEG